MSIGILIDYTDHVTPSLAALGVTLEPAALQALAGRAARTVYQRHLAALDQDRPNALGGRRTNFYGRAARQVSWSAVEGGVLISIPWRGLAQRYFGGTITPIPPKKYLTIPAAAEAHGKTVADFDRNALQFLYGRDGPYAIAERPATLIGFGRRRGDGTRSVRAIGEAGRVLFWLKESVTQEGDTTVLPDPDKVASAISTTISDHVERTWRRGQPPTSAN